MAKIAIKRPKLTHSFRGKKITAAKAKDLRSQGSPVKKL
jgi:hypothetical protein